MNGDFVDKVLISLTVYFYVRKQLLLKGYYRYCIHDQALPLGLAFEM